MSNILVTGGAGFIGGHTALLLREAGHSVIIFDDLSNGHIEQTCGAFFIKGDIRSSKELDLAFREREIDCVIHFAALIEAGRSVQEPELFYDVNVNGTFALLSAMKKAKINHLVFSSTAAVYGNPQQDFITEGHILAPINPYGETKQVCETMLKDAHRKWGLRYAALRYFNASGSDPQGRIGERHNPETHLIPLALDAALGKRPPLKIFGNDYDTPDGTCIRDYVHVCDLATAHIRAIDYIEQHETPLTVNLGTGSGHSVMEVISTVEKISGFTVPYEIAPRRTGDPTRLVCSSDKAKKELGWTSFYPDLETMIKHCFLYRKNSG